MDIGRCIDLSLLGTWFILSTRYRRYIPCGSEEFKACNNNRISDIC